jgi:hypothetical protein
MSSTIFACFLRNDNEIMAAHILNKLAAKMAPKAAEGAPQIHVELFFPDEDGDSEDLVSGQACSIHYNGKVFLTRKQFSRTQWHFRSLDTTKEQYDAILNYCKEAVGRRFNHLGYFLQPFAHINHSWPQDWFGYDKRYYCSELVVEALKAGGVLPITMRSQIHPETLYALLRKETTSACVKNVNKMQFEF